MGQASQANGCSSDQPHSTTTGQEQQQQQQQPGIFTQALDFALQASGTEKPKDTAGWAELFVRAKATVDRNTKKN